MANRDTLNTASNFWSGGSIGTIFKNILCCGCSDRDNKGDKTRTDHLIEPTNSEAYLQYTRGEDADRELLVEQEEFIQFKPQEFQQSERFRQAYGQEREKDAGMTLRDRKQKTSPQSGKGNAHRRDAESGAGYSDEEDADDDDDARSNSSRITKKKIKKQSHRSDKAKSASKGRNPWTNSEDDKLKALISQHGLQWSVISKEMGGARTGKQIRDRYLNKLDPSIKNTEWTAQEDNEIVRLYHQIGSKWCEISRHLEGRTESMVKNRFYSYIKKKKLATSEVADSPKSNAQFSPTSQRTAMDQQFSAAAIQQATNELQSNRTVSGHESSLYTDLTSEASRQRFQPYNHNGEAQHTQIPGNHGGQGYIQSSNGAYIQSNGQGVPYQQKMSQEYDEDQSIEQPKLPFLNTTDPEFLSNQNLNMFRIQSFDRSSLGLDQINSYNRPDSMARRDINEEQNDYDGKKCYELLNLPNNFDPNQGRLPGMEEEEKSVSIAYDFDNGFYQNRSPLREEGAQFYNTQQEFDKQSLPNSLYSETVRNKLAGRKFKTEEESVASQELFNGNMEIEGQLDKLTLLFLDNRKSSSGQSMPSVSKSNSFQHKEGAANGDKEQQNGEQMGRKNMLLQRQKTLEFLLARTYNEIQKSDTLKLTPLSSIKSNESAIKLQPTV